MSEIEALRIGHDPAGHFFVFDGTDFAARILARGFRTKRKAELWIDAQFNPKPPQT